ncbi:MFS transporter [Chloroflexota bacterium]
MSTGWGIGVILVVIGMLVHIRMPASESYVINQTSKRNRSTALGIFYFSSMEGSGVLTPVIGYLIEQFGFYVTFVMAGATVFIVTAVLSPWLLGRHE